MAKDRVTIELYVDDKGTVKIREARAQVESLGATSQKAFSGAESAATAFGSSVGLVSAALIGLVAGAASVYGLQRAFREGLQAADEFRVATIGVAATLTDMAKDKDNVGLVYARNLNFAREMYEQLELEAAKHFGTGRDLQDSFNILVQKGVVARKEDVAALGTLVDKIKLMTQGQNQQIQIAQELRALVDGQARATSQLAMLLRDQLGEGWEDLVKKHREAGDLIQWLASLFPGLQSAINDITNTYEAQKNTLTTHLKYVGREGLGGAYDDMVGWLKQANDWLEANRHLVAGELREGWAEIKPLVQSLLDIMWAMVQAGAAVASVLAKIVGGLSRTSEAMKVEGALSGGIWDMDDASVTAQKHVEHLNKEMAKLPKAAGGMLAGAGLFPEGPAELAKRPGAGAGAGAKAAAKGAVDELTKLRDESAKLSREVGAQWLESWKVMRESFSLGAKFNEEQLQKEAEALTWTAATWQELMDAEGLTYDERLRAQQEFAKAKLKLVDREVAEIRKKYGSLVPEDVLAAYKKGQILDLEKNLEVKGKKPKWVKDISGLLSHAMTRGLMGFIRGEKTDFAEIGIWMAEGLLERGIEAGTDIAVQFVASALGLVPPMLAGATTSGAILTAAGTAVAGQMVAGATAAAAILASVKMIGFFHQGGVVMHGGGIIPMPPLAHAGLNLGPDERLIIAQTGEGILPRRSMAKLGPLNFERLRRGDINLGGGEVNQIAFTQNVHHKMTQREADRTADMIMRALDRKLAKRGRKL